MSEILTASFEKQEARKKKRVARLQKIQDCSQKSHQLFSDFASWTHRRTLIVNLSTEHDVDHAKDMQAPRQRLQALVQANAAVQAKYGGPWSASLSSSSSSSSSTASPPAKQQQPALSQRHASSVRAQDAGPEQAFHSWISPKQHATGSQLVNGSIPGLPKLPAAAPPPPPPLPPFLAGSRQQLHPGIASAAQQEARVGAVAEAENTGTVRRPPLPPPPCPGPPPQHRWASAANLSAAGLDGAAGGTGIGSTDRAAKGQQPHTATTEFNSTTDTVQQPSAAQQPGPAPPPPPPPLPPHLRAPAGRSSRHGAGAEAASIAAGPSGCRAPPAPPLPPPPLAGARWGGVGGSNSSSSNASQAGRKGPGPPPPPPPPPPPGFGTHRANRSLAVPASSNGGGLAVEHQGITALAAAAAAAAGARRAQQQQQQAEPSTPKAGLISQTSGTFASPRSTGGVDGSSSTCSKLKRLHVDPVPRHRLADGSFWRQAGVVVGPFKSQVDYVLRTMFSSTPHAQRRRDGTDAGGADGASGDDLSGKVIKVVAEKRALQVEVALKRLRMTSQQLAATINRLDTEKLKPDYLPQIRAILPKPDELAAVHQAKEKAVKEHAARLAELAAAQPTPSESGDGSSSSSDGKRHRTSSSSSSSCCSGVSSVAPPRLGVVEAAFEALGSVKMLMPKMRACEFSHDIEAVSAQVDDFVTDVTAALEALRTCGQLQYLLAFVRDVANTMNGNSGQHTTAVEGFKLESLGRLQSTRMAGATDLNLLHYIVAHLSVVLPAVLQLDAEREAFKAATKRGTFDSVLTRIRGLHETHKRIQADLAKAREQQQQQQGCSSATSSKGAGQQGSSLTAAAADGNNANGSPAVDLQAGHHAEGQSEYICRLSDLIDTSRDRLAQLQGKMDSVIKQFRWTAEFYSEDVAAGWKQQPAAFITHFLDLLESLHATKQDTARVARVTGILAQFVQEQEAAEELDADQSNEQQPDVQAQHDSVLDHTDMWLTGVARSIDFDAAATPYGGWDDVSDAGSTADTGCAAGQRLCPAADQLWMDVSACAGGQQLQQQVMLPAPIHTSMQPVELSSRWGSSLSVVSDSEADDTLFGSEPAAATGFVDAPSGSSTPRAVSAAAEAGHVPFGAAEECCATPSAAAGALHAAAAGLSPIRAAGAKVAGCVENGPDGDVAAAKQKRLSPPKVMMSPQQQRLDALRLRAKP